MVLCIPLVISSPPPHPTSVGSSTCKSNMSGSWANVQGLGAPGWVSELPMAPGKSVARFVYRGNERCQLWAVSAAALLQGGVLGREGRMEACFSSLPAAHGERKAQRWGASITHSAVLFLSAWAGARKLVSVFLFSSSSFPPPHSRTVLPKVTSAGLSCMSSLQSK